MVYETKELKILHKLTKSGEEYYRQMLEREADKILWQHEHRLEYIWNLIKEWLYNLIGV